ncbi:MAG: undecaprenyldiphospho-muramoylpentapeptide beta-N-acetylglucosaminyltransferase [Alistipes sp.]|nr:undecaprenyldiphospho-muramoylpentapeptide beta-N-acetylglucosaminyltransferase [Alistipes sp.]
MKRVILSGGGTGGHIYPAVAVAEALKRRHGDDIEILFVGAEGKMEMEKIPALGYNIIGLPILGLQRRFTLKNIEVPVRVAKSVMKAFELLKMFKPDVVAGFGGYASAPILWAAQRKKIPTVIQEQNSFAGVANKVLAKRASSICVAYEGMERFFPADKIVMTGNPLRGSFGDGRSVDRSEALSYYGLTSELPVLLVVGGSLGTRTLNNMMKSWIVTLGGDAPVQVIWQTGKYYDAEMQAFTDSYPTAHIRRLPFIDRMDYAYAAADLVISRSGACTVSELCLAGKPTIFVPSPNVAEDHQTKNARALVDKSAAEMVADSDAVECGMDSALKLLANPKRLKSLSANISKLAIADSADRVAAEIEKQLYR